MHLPAFLAAGILLVAPPLATETNVPASSDAQLPRPGVYPLPAATPAESDSTPLERRLHQIVRMLDGTPVSVDTIFGAAFLTQVPSAQLTALIAQFASQLGKVDALAIVESRGVHAARYRFTFSNGYQSNVDLAVSETPPHLIEGLLFSSPVRLAAGYDDVVRELDALHGDMSFLVARIEGDGSPRSASRLIRLATLNADKPAAIGSTFKLYVLAELVRAVRAGERRWSDVIALEEPARSLPSGDLRRWPAGSPLTLHTLATLMIAESDNTATDQLIRTLARERIEAVQAMTGHERPALNTPFFSTRELFVLKSGAGVEAARRYSAADVAGRRAVLTEIARIHTDSIDLRLGGPMAIDTLEWFASAADVARVLVWLRDQTASGEAATARSILAVNPGLGLDAAQWPYVGFKGGSETGVLSLGLLLRNEDGHWYVVVAHWNDRERPVDQAKLLPLIERVIQLAPAAR